MSKAQVDEARVITTAVRDDAKIARAHRVGGREAQEALRRGKGAHVFDEAADLADLERKVWTKGTHPGKLPGTGHRSDFDRFVWQSSTSIGWRIQVGKVDRPHFWVEIKGNLNKAGDWVYHLVPRGGPAT